MADLEAEPEWEEDYPEDVGSDSNSPEYQQAIKDIATRCDTANIKYEFEELDGDIDITIQIPSGRETRSVWISDLNEAQALLATEFENYLYAPGYEGFWHKINNFAEFQLTARMSMRIRRELERTENEKIELSSDNPALPKISLGYASKDFAVLCRGNARSLTLKIESSDGNPIKKSEDAIKLVEKFGSSLLYQIDNVWNVPLSFVRERRRRLTGIGRRRREQVDLTYPSFEYEAAPLSLYSYARNSIGMPLLQFLAYYQTVEYYFPFFSKVEAQKRIRTLLKNPAFRAEKDSDIARLIGAIRETRAGALYDERTMLKATVREVLGSEELRYFLESNGYTDFFKGDHKKICDKKVSVGVDVADLHEQISERIYAIRCKIVHTKADAEGDVELMLPYSDEEHFLGPDVELMSFIARSCINASGVAI